MVDHRSQLSQLEGHQRVGKEVEPRGKLGETCLLALSVERF